MLQSISDSDEEEMGLRLSPDCVNKRKLSYKISLLPTSVRRQLRHHRDFNKYSSILSSQVIQGVVSDDSDVSDSSQESVLDLINLPSMVQPVVNTNVSSETPVQRQQREEDAENLQLFLDANIQNLYSRRGLRKRNFASTYPYLNDKAQYLGLSDSARLNYLYEENHDVEGIIKMLNNAYLQKKKKYPQEERFKAKTFYSFLGVGSKVNRKEDFSDSLEKQDSQSQVPYNNNIGGDGDGDIDTDNEDFEGGYALDKSLDLNPYVAHNRTTSTIIEEESDDDIFDLPPNRNDSFTDDRNIFEFSDHSPEPEGILSDISSQASEDNIVRVGGRFRKAKSILHGALPESTKRLEKTKLTKKRYLKRPKNLEYRKGLAVKKFKSHHKNSLQNEMEGFVDDEVYYRDIDENIDTSSLLPPSEYMNIQQEQVEEEVSNRIEDTEVFEVDSNSDDDISGVDADPEEFYKSSRDTIEFSDDGYDSVIESDRINPLFISRTKTTGNSKTYTRRNKYSSLRGTTRKRQSSLNLPSGSGGLEVSTKPINTNSNRLKKSRTIRPQSRARLPLFGKLQKKRMVKPKKSTTSIIDPKSSENRNHLHYRRDPVTFTTAFEAESETRFIPNKQVGNNISRSVLENLSLSRRRGDESFHADSILGEVDISKIVNIKDGQLFQTLGDSIVVSLLGTRYSFFLFDKQGSQENFEKLLLQIRKVFVSSKSFEDMSLASEVYTAIKGLIKWCLILQEIPSDKSIRFLHLILNGGFKAIEENCEIRQLFMMPFLILLSSIFVQINQKHNPMTPKKLETEQLERYICSFWTQTFKAVDLDEMKSIFNGDNISGFESMHCVFRLQKHICKSWWSPINESLQDVDNFKAHKVQVLSILFVIATMSPAKKQENWTCFYTWYNRFQDDETSQTHNNFLDIIYLLHHQLDWQLQERMVTSLYSTLTKRKFSNFMDESQIPELIGHITSRSDFPDHCFFDRFMEFLYYYISSLPLNYNKKRLITKLITSSQYHYEKNKKHYAMFINRINIILLLSQISDNDLNDQIFNLISQTKNCNDVKLYDAALSGLEYYCQIAIKRNEDLPINSFVVMIGIITNYISNTPGMVSIWKRFSRLMNSVSSDSDNCHKIFQFLEFIKQLDINNFTDDASSAIIGLTLNCVNRIISLAMILDQDQIQTLSVMEDKLVSFLSFQMGRLPITHELNKNRVTNLIEQCIELWVRITFITPKSNWNAILFQKFPYIGNHYLRMEFILFLYLDLSNFIPLDGYLDNILRIILTVAASGQRNRYLFKLLIHLSKKNFKLFSFHNLYLLELLNDTQYLSLKATVLSSIIINIINDNKMQELTKLSYFKELLSTMESEFNSTFKHSYYVDYYKKIMDVLHRNCKEQLNDLDQFKNLSNKLGFHSNDQEIAWKSLKLEEKLSMIHKNLIECLHFGQNVDKMFNKSMLKGSWEVLYNLVYIYVKAISSLQDDKWHLTQLLLEFFSQQLLLGNVKVSEKSFIQFISFLRVLPLLKSKRWNQSQFHYYQWRVVQLSISVLKTTFYIFDGFRDIADVKKIISDFLDLFSADLNPEDVLSEISSFSLFDIQSSNLLSYLPETLDANVESLERTTEADKQDLQDLIKGTRNEETLLFDFDFLG